jgi:hypothetical protein
MQIKSLRAKLIYLLVLLLVVRGGYAMVNKQSEFDIKISEEINNGLRLVIYYYPLDYLIRKSFTENDLINNFYHYKTEVNTKVLKQYIDKLKKMETLNLQEPEIITPVDVRIYGEFLTDTGKIYSFALGGNIDNMVVNGRMYKKDIFFYEFVMEFIPVGEIDKYKYALDNITFEKQD